MYTTAKSTILDIGTNYGNAASVGFRSIEFYLGTALVAIADADITTTATTTLAAHNVSWTVDTSLSKTGAAANNSWASDSATIATRVCITFDTIIQYDRIVLNNYHDSGADTDIGVKDVKLYSTLEDVSTNVYNDIIAVCELLYDGVVPEHIASDEIQDYTIFQYVHKLLQPDAFIINTYNPMANVVSNFGHVVTSSNGSEWTYAYSSAYKNSGKWYWEVDIIACTGGIAVGACADAYTTHPGSDHTSWSYISSSGNTRHAGADLSFGESFTAGDVIGVAVDLDKQIIYFSKNGAWQNSPDAAHTYVTNYLNVAGNVRPAFSLYEASQSVALRTVANELLYPAPTGFEAIGGAYTKEFIVNDAPVDNQLALTIDNTILSNDVYDFPLSIKLRGDERKHHKVFKELEKTQYTTLATPPVVHWAMDVMDNAVVLDEQRICVLYTHNRACSTGGPFNKYLAGGATATAPIFSVAQMPVTFTSTSFWVQRIDLSNTANVLCTHDAQQILCIRNSTSGNVLSINNDGTYTDSSIAITDTEWHHVVIVEDTDSDNHVIYVDGVAAASINTQMSGAFELIGTLREVAGTEAPNITNIQVYNYKLDETDVQFLWHSIGTRNIAVMAGNTQCPVEIEEWAYDDTIQLLINATDTTKQNGVADASNNSHTLALAGAVHVEHDDTVVGDNCIVLDGASYISCTEASVFDVSANNAFTLRAWIKRSATSVDEYVCGQIDSTADTATANMCIKFNAADNHVHVIQAFDDATQLTWDITDANAIITDSTWHHIVVSCNNRTLYFFLDGRLVDTYDVSAKHFKAPTTAFSIGRCGEYASSYFTGSIQGFEVITGASKYDRNFVPAYHLSDVYDGWRATLHAKIPVVYSDVPTSLLLYFDGAQPQNTQYAAHTAKADTYVEDAIAFSRTGTADTTSSANYHRRVLIPKEAITVVGNKIQIEFVHGFSAFSTIDAAWIGYSDETGTAYHFVPGSVKPITMDGQTTFNISDTAYTSDEIDILIDGTKDIVVSAFTSTPLDKYVTIPPTGFNQWHSLTELDPSTYNGFAMNLANNRREIVDTFIVVQETTPNSTVWDAHYEIVYHMNQDMSSDTYMFDSSRNKNHMTTSSSFESTDCVRGIANKATYFDGAQYITSAQNIEASGNIARTTELIAHVTSPGAHVCTYGENITSKKCNIYTEDPISDGFRMAIGDASKIWPVNLSYRPIYIAVTWDTADGLEDSVGYADGHEVTATSSSTAAINTTATPFTVGAFTDGSYFTTGTIDEVRLSSTQRSADWIALTNACLRDTVLTWSDTDTYNTVNSFTASIAKNSIVSTVQDFPVTMYLSGDNPVHKPLFDTLSVDKATKLLVHANSPYYSTSAPILDSSLSQHTISHYVAGIKHSAIQNVLGASSIALTGTGALSLPDSSDFVFTGDFTIDMWVLPTTGSGTLCHSNYSAVTVNKFHALYADSADSARVIIEGTGVLTGITLTPNTWQHYALVRSGTTLTAYVNGEAVASATYSSTIGAQTNNYLFGDTNAAHSGNGYVDELRIVNGVAVWTDNFTPATTPYTVQYDKKLCITSNGTYCPVEIEEFTTEYRDAVRLLLHGDAVSSFDNTISDESSYNTPIMGTAKHYIRHNVFHDSSMYFDGTNSYEIDVTEHNVHVSPSGGTSVTGAVDFTIDCWAYIDGVNDGGIYSLGAPGSGSGTIDANCGGICIEYIANTTLKITAGNLKTDGVYYHREASTDHLIIGRMNHIAVCCKDNVLYAFVNGKLQNLVNAGVGTLSNLSTAKLYSPRTMQIMSRAAYYGGNDDTVSSSDAFFYTGSLDEYRFIRGYAQWTEDFTPPTAPYEKGYAILHTKLPAITVDQDTHIAISYGVNADDNNGFVGYTGSHAAQDVWSENFAAVFHMNNEGVLLDSTTNKLQLTANGTPTAVITEHGHGIEFGASDYLTHVHTNALSLTSLDVMAWVRKDTTTAQAGCIAAKGTPHSAASAYEWTLEYDAYNAVFNVSDGTAYTSTHVVFKTDEWHTICTGYDYAHAYQYAYYNGQMVHQQLSADIAIQTSAEDEFVVGAHNDGSNSLSGVVQELRISNNNRSKDWAKLSNASITDNLFTWESITQREVGTEYYVNIPGQGEGLQHFPVTLYINGASGVTDASVTDIFDVLDPKKVYASVQPVVHYTMDNVQGTTIYDEINNAPGALMNMAIKANGMFTNYVAHTVEALSTPNYVDVGVCTFTSISLWAARSRTDTNTQVLGRTDPAVGSITIEASPDNRLFVYDGSTNYSTFTIDDTQWHHIVIVQGTDYSTHWVYIDGVKHGTELSTGLAGVVNTLGCNVASANGGHAANIDNVQVYDYALTDADVRKLYAYSSWNKLRIQQNGIDVPVEVEYWDAFNKQGVLHAACNIPTTGTELRVQYAEDNNDHSVLSVAQLSDNFDTINGRVNSVLWDDVTTGTDFDIVHGQLRVSHTGVFDVSKRSTYVLQGDFDVQVDVNLTSAPDVNAWYTQLMVTDSDHNSSDRISIERRYNTASYYACTCVISDVVTSSTYGTTATESTIRLVRYNTVVKAYYYENNEWQLLQTDTGFTQDDVYIMLRAYTTSSMELDVAFDNYIVNTADAVQGVGYIGIQGTKASAAVWDADYLGVFHLNTDPSISGACIADSTTNAAHGTPSGTMTSSALTQGVKTGITFDGVDDYITTGVDSTEYSVTLEAFFNTTTIGSGSRMCILSDFYDTESAPQYVKAALWIDGTQSHTINAGVFDADSSWKLGTQQAGSINDAQCHYAAYKYEHPDMYTVVDTNSVKTSITLNTSASDTSVYRIATHWSDTQNDGFYQGVIHEVRFSSSKRTDAWLQCTMSSLHDTLLTWNAQSTQQRTSYTYDVYVDGQDEQLDAFPLTLKINKYSGISSKDTTDIFDVLSGSALVADALPVAHWELRERYTDTVLDNMCAHNGVHTNMAYTVGGPFTAYLPGGIISSAVKNVEFTTPVPFKSVSMWVQRIDTTNTNVVFVGAVSGSYVYLANSGQGSYVTGITNNVPDYSDRAISGTTEWYHLTVVEGSTPNKHYFYVNGARSASEHTTGVSGAIGWLGFNNISAAAKVVNITNVQVYDYALSQAEVLDLYDAITPWKRLRITQNAVPLYTEVEHWHTQEKSATLHTACTIPKQGNTKLTVDYTPTNESTDTYIGPVNSDAGDSVWDDNYEIVMHMAQDPSGTAPQIRNSAVDRNGTCFGSMTTDDLILTDYGMALTFDTNDYVQILPLSAVTSNITIELLAAVPNLTAAAALSAQYNSNESGWIMFIQTDGTVSFDGRDTTYGSYMSSGVTSASYDDSVFHHFVSRRTGANRAVIINAGDEASANLGTGAIGGADWLTIGCYKEPGGTAAYFAKFTLAEYRISNIARSDTWLSATNMSLKDNLCTWGTVGEFVVENIPNSQKLDIYVDTSSLTMAQYDVPITTYLNATCGTNSYNANKLFTSMRSPNIDDHTLVALPFEGTVGTAYVYDNVADVRFKPIGTVGTAPTYHSSDPVYGLTCAYFAGSGNRIEITPATWDNAWVLDANKDFTIDVWCRCTDITQTERTIISRWDTDGDNMSWCVQQYGDVYRIKVYDVDSVVHTCTSTASTVVHDTWQHIAFVKHKHHILLFINGALNAVHDLQTAILHYDETEYIDIGISRAAGSTYIDDFKGYMDGLRISTTARWTTDFILEKNAYSYTPAKRIAAVVDNEQVPVEINEWTHVNSAVNNTLVLIPQTEGLSYATEAYDTASYIGTAFNNDTTTGGAANAWYASADGSAWATTGFVGKQYAQPKLVRKVRMFTANATYDPRDFTIEASMNGSNWISLLSVKDAPHPLDWTDYVFKNNNAYHIYRINVSQNWGDATNCIIHEVQFFDVQYSRACMHIKVPELHTMPVATSIVAETPSYILSDEFTGNDEDAPDSNLWEVTNNSVAGTAQINSNKLRITIPNTANDENIMITSKFKLSDDFDVQVDYNEVSNDLPSSSVSYLHMLRYVNSSRLKYGFISVGIGSASERTYAASNTLSSTNITTTYSSGKYRLTRASGVIKAYYWTGSQWEWDGSTNGIVLENSITDDVYIDILSTADFSSGATTDFDNFQINSGTIVWP